MKTPVLEMYANGKGRVKCLGLCALLVVQKCLTDPTQQAPRLRWTVP